MIYDLRVGINEITLNLGVHMRAPGSCISFRCQCVTNMLMMKAQLAAKDSATIALIGSEGRFWNNRSIAISSLS